jgi:hypothetical protein
MAGYAGLMPRRAPRPRDSRALGAGTAFAATLLAAALVHPVSHAQPAQPAQPAPDLGRARDRYQSAEAAMKDGRFEDALRDYGAAYESSKDPALLWKIGHANEKAGKCDVALVYYARYLRDGHPSEKFITLTQERIAACGQRSRWRGWQHARRHTRQHARRRRGPGRNRKRQRLGGADLDAK